MRLKVASVFDSGGTRTDEALTSRRDQYTSQVASWRWRDTLPSEGQREEGGQDCGGYLGPVVQVTRCVGWRCFSKGRRALGAHQEVVVLGAVVQVTEVSGSGGAASQREEGRWEAHWEVVVPTPGFWGFSRFAVHLGLWRR